MSRGPSAVRRRLEAHLTEDRVTHAAVYRTVNVWLKTQGIGDALIQPYSGHATRQSLEIYSRIALADAQHAYNEAITSYPV